MNRRDFLVRANALAVAPFVSRHSSAQLIAPPATEKKVAALVTTCHRYSHADNIVTRFMEVGVLFAGSARRPPPCLTKSRPLPACFSKTCRRTVGILFGYVIAQAGGLRIVPTGADAYDVQLFGKLAWTGTGHPRADYGRAIMAFIVVGWLTATVTRWTLMWYFRRDDSHEPA